MALPATDGAKLYAADVNKLGPFNTFASKSDNTVYQAATDGFVFGYTSTSSTTVYAYTDSSNPPTTVRARSTSPSSGSATVICPVKRGDYYKTVNCSTVYWIPIGA